jgi:hypothetical protein
MLPPEFDVSEDDESSDQDRLEIPVRRPLLEEPAILIRRISDRSPPKPPTLQLRRPSSTASASPRTVSGLSAIANTPPPATQFSSPQFSQLKHPGPGPVAPPYLTTTPAVATDLPYSPPTVGSSSSARVRLTQLQSGHLFEEPLEMPASTSSSTGSDERLGTTTGSKPKSLEHTRYALSQEAQTMIRRLSNGPPGLIRRTSSPSPPSLPTPSGWTRPERVTRTTQKQLLMRDLLEAQEQQHEMYSAASIARPESRTDYFNPPMHNQPTAEMEDDPFLNTYPRLNQELRRINKELSNIKKFSDPMADAIQRLAERKSGSPLIPVTQPPLESRFQLPSSWMKRFSPEKRDTPPDRPPLPRKTSLPSHLPDPPPSRKNSLKNSLPSRLRETTPAEQPESDDEQSSVFNGEQESRLQEVTRQLWYSWPEIIHETEDGKTEDGSTEAESTSMTTSGGSPEEVRNSHLHPLTVERRSFGSGLRKGWGSALSLAGIKHS